MKREHSDISFSGATNSNLMIFVVVISSFILVSLWNDSIQMIYYEMFCYDRTSPLDSLFLSVVVTGFVILLALCLRYSSCEVKGE